MKVLLLAAGYSKRLNELTENTPKSLLPLNGKPILDYLIEKLEKVSEIDDVYLVTNNKYISNFEQWLETYKGRLKISLLNDMTNSNEERLGAIGDIMLSIDHFGINEDLLISATDAYFEFNLNNFVEYFNLINSDLVLAKKYENREELKRLGVANLSKTGTITLMEEKPQEPKSDIAIFATYIYKKETLPLFHLYKSEGRNMDAPGNFVSWLYQQKPVNAFVVEQEIFDIGTVDSYNKADQKTKTRTGEQGK